jgi:hypothetical protein
MAPNDSLASRVPIPLGDPIIAPGTEKKPIYVSPSHPRLIACSTTGTVYLYDGHLRVYTVDIGGLESFENGKADK